MASGQSEPFEKLTLAQKFGCGLSIMAAIMAWIIGRIVILANSSPVPHPDLGQIYPVSVGRYERLRTVYLDAMHFALSWVLQAPFYAFLAGCFGYTIYIIGRRIFFRHKLKRPGLTTQPFLLRQTRRG